MESRICRPRFAMSGWMEWRLRPSCQRKRSSRFNNKDGFTKISVIQKFYTSRMSNIIRDILFARWILIKDEYGTKLECFPQFIPRTNNINMF